MKMRYAQIDKELFIQNRKKFVARMKPNSIAVFNSNDILPTNADGVLPFKQNSDLFYLTGIDQEETTLVLFPDCNNEEYREVLFCKETSELIQIWEGHKLSKSEAQSISGIDTVLWNSQLDATLFQLIPDSSSIYLNQNEHSRATREVETRDDRFLTKIKSDFPLHLLKRSAPLLHQLRYVKSSIEVEQIQKACNITEKAFRRVLNFVKPDVFEYEIEAEITHEFLINRSRGHAYQPIVASGADSCVLHYIDNDKACKAGELILMDFGAEYANYNSDLTRTIPVSGKYTSRQKEVYNAVLDVMKFAISQLVVGNTFKEYNKAIASAIEEKMVNLGLLTMDEIKNQNPKMPAFRKYFMHGTSHSLGLDVHDVDDRSLPFEAGMIFTCEPGIYIPSEKIGIRIENDILITKDGNIDLMKNIPIEADEIEELMN